MGTVVDRNTLKAMIMTILSKDKELCKDVLREIVKENPVFKDEVAALSVESAVTAPLIHGEANVEKIEQENSNSHIGKEELDYWINEHFKEYDAVFRALA